MAVPVVAEAASAAAGYRRFLECMPDVVITDLSLPGVGGIELLRRLRARQPELRALAFSVHEESMFVDRALAAGALGELEAGHPKSAAVAFSALAEETETGYLALARLRAADALALAGDISGAVALYDQLSADSRADLLGQAPKGNESDIRNATRAGRQGSSG